MNSRNTLRKKRRRKQKKRNAIFLFLVISILCTTFFIGNKIIKISKSVAVAADIGDTLEKEETVQNDTSHGDDIKFNIDSDKIENEDSNINKDLIEEINEKQIMNDDEEKEIMDNEEKNKDNLESEDGQEEKEKICYLTFDDGPTKNITPQILEVLDDYNVRATFFVVGQLAEQNSNVLKKIDKAGHYIGNHTYSHKYDQIYVSPSAMIRDIEKCNEVLNKYIGKTTNIIRFPGGSFGKTDFQERVNNDGYIFVDWNCLNGDAEALNVPPERLLERTKETMNGQDSLIVLMHDATTKQTTVQALPKIIKYIKSEGYVFKTLDEAF